MNHLQNKSHFLNVSLFLSIFFYSLFGLLFSIYSVNFFRIPQTVALIGFIIVSIYFVKQYLQSSKKILFTVFIVCQLFIVVRINNINLESLRVILFDPLHFCSYLIPFVIFLPVRLSSLKEILRNLFLFSLIFILLHLYLIYQYPINNFTDIIVISSLAPVGIILLLARYTNKKIVFLSFLIVLTILIIGLVYGRRSVVVNASLFFLFFFNINVLGNDKIRFEFKALSVLFGILAIVYLINYFIGNVNANNFEIFNRLDEDSRSDVFEAFIKDFDFSDYLVGRGIDGAYYNPIKYWNFSNDDYREVNYRTNIESGFLYMIMKGGLIYLVTFLLILLRAMYMGFFKSKNSLLKGLAAYLLIYFFDMFVYGQPTFSIKYCLVWISISVCLSKKMLSMNEKKLLEFIKPTKHILTHKKNNF
ncbi:O-antigen polysaccharide polymerase Wzy [Flavobacterium sp. DGU38]|uniref:O-antigen polysaccharide polymerase Wzy n=1 Tax=Flavobacterium calami TaxID=3139144 RepID=A0ABU9IP90_9FLAO